MKEVGKGRNYKKCTRCSIVKKLTEFGYKTKKQNARRTACKECVKKYKSNDEYREKQRVYAKKRRHENPEIYKDDVLKSKERGRTIRGRAQRLYYAARNRSEVNGLEFSISKEQIEVKLALGFCEKTGIKLCYKSPPKGFNFNPNSPSIDRKNSFEGYVIENIQIVCNKYNLAKNQMTDNELLEFCKLVIERSVK